MALVEKDVLRGEMLKKRAELSPVAVLTKSENIISKIKDLSLYKNAKTIMIFHPIKNEVNLLPLLSDPSKTFCFPKVSGKILECRSANGNFNRSKFGVLESDGEMLVPDLSLVPGLVFSRKMDRIGYGKGFYDKFLTEGMGKVGVCFSLQLVDSLPAQDFDVKMDLIVTDEEILKL